MEAQCFVPARTVWASLVYPSNTNALDCTLGLARAEGG